MEPLKIVFIGSGNVATHLSKKLHSEHFKVVQVFSKTLANAKILAEELGVGFSNQLKNITDEGDVYIFSVKDDVLNAILNKRNWQNKLLLHTSGSMDMSVFKPYTQNYGVLYPLQTFTKSKKVKFKKLPLLIEANTVKNRQILAELANSISSHVQVVSSKQRKMLHLSAVFACNFTNHLLAISEALCQENKVDFTLIQPLVKETFKKVKSASPKLSQTGPAKRKDLAIIEMQKQLLQNHPNWQAIYDLITADIIDFQAVE